MRRLAIASLVLVAALLWHAAVAAANPRDEQVRLTSADRSLARRTLLKGSDLNSGWRTAASTSRDNDGDRSFECPGYRPDFSAYTITGEADNKFRHRSGASIDSFVSVFATRKDASGDFQAAAKPGLARCLRSAFNAGVSSVPGANERIDVSARMLSSPSICGCSGTAAYRIVARIGAGSSRLVFYVDFLVFQKGRSIGGLLITTPFAPLPDRLVLARAMASRMR
jgi:hypothetical protein